MNLHDKLQINLDKVIKQFHNEEIILTPYFSIGKNVPENLHQYKRFQNQQSPAFLIKYLAIYIFRVFFYIFRPLIHHIYHFKDFKKYYSQLPKKFKRVFISHFTGAHNQLNTPDRYFGEVIPMSRINKEENLILLINHTRKNPDRKMKTKLSSNSIYYILPKTTETKIMFHIYKKQVRRFFKILFMSQKPSINQKCERVYMYELAIQQLSQSAISQQVLFYNLAYALESGNTEELYLTYEGHSYEAYLAIKVQSFFNKTRINVYQFAPIVPSQTSFYKNLERLPESVGIHVTGKSIQRQIIEMTQILPSRINIKGSSKNKEDINISELKKYGEFTILFAPEPMQDSFLEFADLAVICAQSLPDCRIVVRPHPDTSNNNKMKIRRVFSKNSNLLLSNTSLENELSQAKICVYRSSSVGIQGLQFGVVPIHFSKLIDGSVDPIRIEDLQHLRCSEITTLMIALKEYIMMSEKSFSKLQRGLPGVFEKYFERLSIN